MSALHASAQLARAARRLGTAGMVARERRVRLAGGQLSVSWPCR